jgi:hypothetical protein
VPSRAPVESGSPSPRDKEQPENRERELEPAPEDIPDRVEDHLADATRYLIRRSTKPTVRFGRVG